MKQRALQAARRRRLPLAALPRRAREGDARGRSLPRLERHAQARPRPRATARRAAHAGRQPGRLGRSRERSAPALDGPAQRVREDRRGLQPHAAPSARSRSSAASSARARSPTSCARSSGSAAQGVVEVNLISQDTDRVRPRPRATDVDLRRAGATRWPRSTACAGCASSICTRRRSTTR